MRCAMRPCKLRHGGPPDTCARTKDQMTHTHTHHTTELRLMLGNFCFFLAPTPNEMETVEWHKEKFALSTLIWNTSILCVRL